MEKATTYFNIIIKHLFKVPGYTSKCARHYTEWSRHNPWLHKYTIKQINSAEWAQTANLQLWAFSQPDAPMVPLFLFCGSGEYMQRKKLTNK